MTNSEFTEVILSRLAQAQFVMLRYETEFTPCTGITAVTKQERRHFLNGVMVAPWCPELIRKAGDDPIQKGLIRRTDLTLTVNRKRCGILAATDDFAPAIFLDVDGRFRGRETPYDTPPEPPEHSSLATLKRDTLYFALAVEELFRTAGLSGPFVWAADWETVPALSLVRANHTTALTLHNTFDECLAEQADEFGTTFATFGTITDSQGVVRPSATALQLGLSTSDVVTTVNRGFAYGMRTEHLQQDVMAKHLRHLLTRVVGINNAAFSPLAPDLVTLRRELFETFGAGRDHLFAIKRDRLEALPDNVRSRAVGKAVVVSMGRRVAQKQHDVLVESVRAILTKDPAFPLLVIFATVHGDAGSFARLTRIQKLAADYPSNVLCEDGQLSYYKELMAAADFNCMPSLYEPHGGAFEGTVVPIARAVDGLAEQICGLEPTGIAATLNAHWHLGAEPPSGLLFRETEVPSGHLFVRDEQGIRQTREEQLSALLEVSPSPDNTLFRAMRDSLTEVLTTAVRIRLDQPDLYARLALAALTKQQGTSWYINLGGMLALIEEARVRRDAA
jgi:glycogen synthase